jgi:hypothetical protein
VNLERLRQLASRRHARLLMLVVLSLLPLSLAAHDLRHAPGDFDAPCIACQLVHKKGGPAPGFHPDHLIAAPAADSFSLVTGTLVPPTTPPVNVRPARGPPSRLI